MTPALLDKLVPFHLKLDPELTILHVGPALAKLLPEAVGRRLDEVFSTVRPKGVALDDACLAQHSRDPCVLIAGEQMLRVAAHRVDTGWLLAVSPVFSSIEQVADAGLMLGDFAAHEATSETLIALNQLSNSLAQAAEVAKKLRRKTREEKESRQRAEAAALAKSRFLSTLSHEIRTPMNGVVGVSELLAATALTEEQRGLVSIVQQSSQTLLRLVNDALDVAQIEAGKLSIQRRPERLGSVVEAVVRSLAPRAEGKGLELRVDSAGADDWFDLDGARVSQLLFNVLGNAIKFTSAGSVRLECGYAETAGMLNLTVQDTGDGMTPETLERLYQPFERGDDVRNLAIEGAGLGMTIVHHLVEALDGEIHVSSEVGVGTTVAIALPVEPAAPAEARQATEREGFVGRVLVVDDNPINLKVAEAMLERLGLETQTVPSGEAALEVVAATAFDLIFMDCQMPGLDGFQTTAQLRQRSGPCQGAVIIALTADVLGDVESRCLAAGMNALLPKPLRLELLHECLTRWLPEAAA
ncbi:MAG: ATP-binding protein [Pseudomonadota bacterium]